MHYPTVPHVASTVTVRWQLRGMLGSPRVRKWDKDNNIFWAKIWRTRIALCAEVLSWSSIHLPVLVQLWPNLPDTLVQSVQNCLVKCDINWFDLQEQISYGWCHCCRRLRSTVFWPWMFADSFFYIYLFFNYFFWSRGSRRTPRHQLPFWFRIEVVAPSLISRDDVLQKQWILVTHGNEVSKKFPSILLSAHLWACAAQFRSRSSAYLNHRGRWCEPCIC